MTFKTLRFLAFLTLLLPVLRTGAVELKWDLGDKKALTFKAVTREVDLKQDPDAKFLVRETVEALMDPASALGTQMLEKWRTRIKALEMPKDADALAVVRARSDRHREALLIRPNAGMPGAASEAGLFDKLIEKKTGIVDLRLLLGADGTNKSFYLDAQARSWAAFAFELPPKAVRAGDTWELNAHLIQLAGNFKVSAQGRISRVELLDLKKQDGGEIAVIGYLHGEFVEGLAPQPFGTPQKQVFSAAIFGRGEFHVTQGRWKELVGRMQVGDSAEEDVRQNHIALEYFPDVPEQLMDLER